MQPIRIRVKGHNLVNLGGGMWEEKIFFFKFIIGNRCS